MKKLLVLLASSDEWYEFTVYSFCAVYIGNAFFPNLDSPFANFLAAFGAFAAGFLARPFGGLSLDILVIRSQEQQLLHGLHFLWGFLL